MWVVGIWLILAFLTHQSILSGSLTFHAGYIVKPGDCDNLQQQLFVCHKYAQLINLIIWFISIQSIN